MSFMKTLATLAVGFAAARGLAKYNQMGGAAGMQEALRGAGKEGGVADHMGAMAEKVGIKGRTDNMRAMMDKLGEGTASAIDYAQTGMQNIFSAVGKMMGTGAEIAGAAAGPGAEDNAKLMIRAMIQGAKADGEISAQEREVIFSHLGESSDDEKAFVAAEMAAPVDIAGLAASVSDGAKAQIYSAALMAITVDTEGEQQFLNSLAAALGLDAATVAQLHHTMGRPAA